MCTKWIQCCFNHCNFSVCRMWFQTRCFPLGWDNIVYIDILWCHKHIWKIRKDKRTIKFVLNMRCAFLHCQFLNLTRAAANCLCEMFAEWELPSSHIPLTVMYTWTPQCRVKWHYNLTLQLHWELWDVHERPVAWQPGETRTPRHIK